MKNNRVIFILNDKHPEIDDQSSAITYWYGILENMGYEVVYQPYKEYNTVDFYKSAKSYNPKFVIFTNYFEKIHTEFQALREFTKVFLLSSDMHRFYEGHVKFWIPFVDGIINFEGTKEWCLRDGLQEDGFLKMRWGFNPNTMSYPNMSKDINILHYGGLHGDRTKMINEFTNKSIDISVSQNVTYEELKQYLSRSKYSLCFSLNAVMDRRELKGRVVEIPAHSVLLTENADELYDYYDDTEMILFNSVDEAIEKIKYYNHNVNEYNKILQNGKRAIWNKNTVYHEWNKILPKMDSNFEMIDVIKLLKEKHGDYYES